MATDCATPERLFSKTTISKGVGFFVPIDGAVCKLIVISDEKIIITELDNDKVKEVVIGEADSYIDHILEACLCTMKEDEVCEVIINLSPTDDKPKEKEKKTKAKYLEDIEEMKSPVVEEATIKEDSTLLKALEDSQIKEELDNKKDEDIMAVETEKNHQEMEEDIMAVESVKNHQEIDEEIDGNETVEIVEEIEPIATGKIQIQLLSFSRQPEIWEMSVTEKWRRATHHKEQGIELFSKGEYRWAFRRFSSALKYLISVEHDIPPERLEEDIDVKGLKLSCYLNLAACHLKKPNYEAAITVCTKALELDAYNVKALYRRGSALIQLQDYEKAKKDLNSAAELEPKNAAITKQQQLLKARLQKLNKFYAKAMKKMFA